LNLRLAKYLLTVAGWQSTLKHIYTTETVGVSARVLDRIFQTSMYTMNL